MPYGDEADRREEPAAARRRAPLSMKAMTIMPRPAQARRVQGV